MGLTWCALKANPGAQFLIACRHTTFADACCLSRKLDSEVLEDFKLTFLKAPIVFKLQFCVEVGEFPNLAVSGDIDLRPRQL